ncbi:MAG TPA: hypothetical protein VFO01_02290 [Trebonia sp.]|nr:hypothetical protein [Trebonia sp.]
MTFASGTGGDDDRPRAGSAFRWTLHTAAARGLYEKYGCAAPDETCMDRRRRRPVSAD